MAKKSLSFDQVAALAESVGMPGIAMAQIAKGESGYRVDAIGHDPGGTQGLGLWQITTGYNDDIIKRFGGRQKLLTDPLANARAAKAIYDRQGIKAWYGTKYLEDPTAHYKGHGKWSPIAQAAAAEPQTGYQSRTQLTPTAEKIALPERKRAPVTGPELPEFARKGASALQALASSTGPDRSNRLDVRGALTTLSANAASLQQSQQAAPTATAQTAQTQAPSGVKGSKVLELIFNDGGKGYGIKNGQVVDGKSVYSNVWGGHADHVHVAAGPKTVVELGRLAEGMGLKVGENPHFGGVDPVHVSGSYHYKGEAIDVSGDPSKMAAYAKRVMAYQRGR